MNAPIKYVKSCSKNIAYRVSGQGSKSLILVNGWVTNLEELHTLPGLENWLKDLQTFSSLTVFDKRGVGLSDRVNEQDLPGLSERLEDMRSIMNREGIPKLKKVVSAISKTDLICPALSASLNYFNSLTTGRLPANMIQAQRDYFGAHTYQRVDKEGSFHTEWQDIKNI